MTQNPTTTINSTSTEKVPLTAQELLAHPAFSTNDWSARIPPTSTGYAPINAGSRRPGGPFSIYYELHGTGSTKIVGVMGLGAFRTAWKRQSKFFGHERKDKYTMLVYDNRGVGLSGKPSCRYSTREMAADVVELLSHIGWLEKDVADHVLTSFYSTTSSIPKQPGTAIKRTLNIAGVSMGGMIVQELALLIPDYIQSLFLISTAPRLVRTVPFLENIRQRINMFIPRDINVQLDEVAHRLFSSEFLDLPDHEEADPALNFPMTQDRFAASELAKRQDKEGFTRKGFILQAVAAGWHHKSPEQMREIVEKVGAERICVMHGTLDRMITFRHFELFKEDMGEKSGVEFLAWDGRGHVLLWEEESRFNEAIEGFIERTRSLNDRR